jgi:hypothetical protein
VRGRRGRLAWLARSGLAACAHGRHPHPAAVLGMPMKIEWIALFICVAARAIAVAVVYALD